MPSADGLAFFERRIRPVLVEHCYECHSDERGKAKGGLRVDTRERLAQGGDTGPAITPGNLQRSLLLEAIRYTNQNLQMPPKSRLPAHVVADFAAWIQAGAADPRTDATAQSRATSTIAPAAASLAGATKTAATSHWAFLPPAPSVPLPAVRNSAWIKSPIDRFILARLEAARLRPAPPAERVTLLRRLTFDLLGLPPTPEEIDAFLADDSPGALPRVVERLLASPHYGERWGRHWLDVARYADSNGQDENKAMSHAWRYRDYVIASFNQDKPFDQFIREQLAGDLLPPSVEERENLERLIATGFLVLGPKMLAEQDKPKLVMDVVDEQIDVVSRAFLGLTVSCSRCHDHKFDPISARDYYALAGIFKSTKTMGDLAFVSKWNERAVAPRAEMERFNQFIKRTNELERSITRAIRQADEWLREGALEPDERVRPITAFGDQWPTAPPEGPPVPWSGTRQAAAGWTRELARLRASPPATPAVALGVEEASSVELPVHVRGSHLTPAGKPIPRGFIQVLALGPSAAIYSRPPIPSRESGRRQLAEWITDPDHPLTARVTVNRIWQAWFGEGLVRTPDNFGLRGETASHPELLDWLAREFIRTGWSFKQMHRLIALSAAYQMSTAYHARSAQFDPDNRLLWRMNRRRLDAESVRDALLASAGRLDRTMGGSLVSWINADYTPADTVSAASRRRAVYLPVVRDRVYDLFNTFDFANPSVGVSRRSSTVVAHQALFFLNSPLVREQARHLAGELLASTPGEPDAFRMQIAYRRILGRQPRPAEVRRALRYLSECEDTPQRGGHPTGAAPGSNNTGKTGSQRATDRAWASLCQALLASNEFLYLD